MVLYDVKLRRASDMIELNVEDESDRFLNSEVYIEQPQAEFCSPIISGLGCIFCVLGRLVSTATLRHCREPS